MNNIETNTPLWDETTAAKHVAEKETWQLREWNERLKKEVRNQELSLRYTTDEKNLTLLFLEATTNELFSRGICVEMEKTPMTAKRLEDLLYSAYRAGIDNGPNNVGKNFNDFLDMRVIKKALYDCDNSSC